MRASCNAEPRLADAARAGQGQEPPVPQQRHELFELAGAPNERAGVRGQRRPSAGRGGTEGGELVPKRAGERHEIVASLRRPVVVAVLWKQVTRVER